MILPGKPGGKVGYCQVYRNPVAHSLRGFVFIIVYCYYYYYYYILSKYEYMIFFADIACEV